MQFIVRIDIDVPNSVPTETAETLKAAERSRAVELARSGRLHRLWRDPDRWANWGLWEATDEAELLTLIDGLPLGPYMTAKAYPVVAHPSDPLAAAIEPTPLKQP